MPHPSKSCFTNSWKYSLALSVLLVFAMNFNTKISAQTSVKTSKNTVDDQQNILKFIVTKDTKDSQLDFIKDKLSDNGATISFNDLNRNSKNEITGIKIQFNYKNSTGNHTTKSSEPIQPIEISINPSGNSIAVGPQVSGLDQTFDVDTNNGQRTIVVTSSKTSSTNTSSSDKNDSIFSINKDNLSEKDSILIKTTVDTIRWINYGNKNFHDINTENNLIVDPEKAPIVIFNGKKLSQEEINELDPKIIKSIHVLKNDEAIKRHDDANRNGIIIITSNTSSYVKSKSGELISVSENQNKGTHYTSVFSYETDKKPLYILDGEEITSEQLFALDSDTIKSINVLKDKKATEKYGEKGENGVIIITLKEK